MKQMQLVDQVSLLHRCVTRDLSVTAELSKIGLDIDSLRYRQHTAPCYGSYFDPIPAKSGVNNAIPAVSFFAGAGGLDLGLEHAGFKTLLAFEIEGLFASTLRRNFPDMKVYGPPFHKGDLSDVDQIIATIESSGIQRGFDGLFHGGPPCQPFSIAANQRFSKSGDRFKRVGFESPKGTLIFDYLAVVLHFMPRWVLIENVPGLADIDGGEQISSVIQSLNRAGYWVNDPLVLNARDFGVPQERKRLFVIATRDYQLLDNLERKKLSVVSDVLSDNFEGLSGHYVRDHKAESLLRYMELGFGERDQLGRVDRLTPNAPSKTVIAGGRNGGGRSHLHPYVPRTLSPRECARLQTFPDWFEFEGSGARQFTQIGNAVPPMLAYQVGKLLAR